MTLAYLALGSNLGDRRALLQEAIAALDWGDTKVTARSSVYETTPVGGPPDQPDFLNQVIAVETALDPFALWERCSAVEAALGRDRTFEERWGPRALDIDVLLYGDQVVEEDHLVIPHPRIVERAFVLVPLAEIAPDVTVPGRGRAQDLLRGLGSTDGVRPVAPG